MANLKTIIFENYIQWMKKQMDFSHPYKLVKMGNFLWIFKAIKKYLFGFDEPSNGTKLLGLVRVCLVAHSTQSPYNLYVEVVVL